MLENSKEPIRSINEALQKIEKYSGKVENFELSISVTLLDEAGVAMAIITDEILAKGWMPNGYSEADGARIFRYTES